MRFLITLLGFLSVATGAYAQSCPSQNSQGIGEAPEVSVLHGKLLYHDDLRQWLGLSLDHATCGEDEVQLVLADAVAERRTESLRGCSVTVAGRLYVSPTGYYSKNMAMSDPTVTPDTSCKRLPVKADFSTNRIAPELRIYHASITVDYRGKGHVVVRTWKDQTRLSPLQPWQAYANYFLNGAADAITFGCRKGFELNDVTQIPKASSANFALDTSQASTNLGDLAATNTISFTCRKERSRNSQ